jgi:hypothetical protein
LNQLNNAQIVGRVDKKEWKKHHGGKRREKLRILNKHLDQHPDF